MKDLLDSYVEWDCNVSIGPDYCERDSKLNGYVHHVQ